MSFRKSSANEFNIQLKEIKAQLQEQLKCLEQRTETQLGIYHEISDFCKKRAEIDQGYAKDLEKLVKSSLLRYKSEKTK
jgi:SLIT-ROBO Rho GTPase activating protein